MQSEKRTSRGNGFQMVYLYAVIVLMLICFFFYQRRLSNRIHSLENQLHSTIDRLVEIKNETRKFSDLRRREHERSDAPAE